MEDMRKGARAFRNAPLMFIPEHYVVFRGCTMVGNCSVVSGADPLDVGQLTDILEMPPSPEHSTKIGRRKGKRVNTPGSASGGFKRTQSDSVSDALHRLADLRIKSNESEAQR